MEKLSDNLKKIFLAGVGAVAVTAEKSKELLDEMVEKGELTVEQGKVLNEELKHNIKKTVKEKVNVSVKPSSAEELSELLDKMTPEQIAALKEQIRKKETEAADDAGLTEEGLHGRIRAGHGTRMRRGCPLAGLRAPRLDSGYAAPFADERRGVVE